VKQPKLDTKLSSKLNYLR